MNITFLFLLCDPTGTVRSFSGMDQIHYGSLAVTVSLCDSLNCLDYRACCNFDLTPFKGAKTLIQPKPKGEKHMRKMSTLVKYDYGINKMELREEAIPESDSEEVRNRVKAVGHAVQI